MGPSRVLVVDGDAGRRAARVQALGERGLLADSVEDALGALKLLPERPPDVLLLALDTVTLDLDTLVRGIFSMAALEHLQMLAVGEPRPMSARTLAALTLLPLSASSGQVAREAERLAARARKKRP